MVRTFREVDATGVNPVKDRAQADGSQRRSLLGRDHQRPVDAGRTLNCGFSSAALNKQPFMGLDGEFGSSSVTHFFDHLILSS